MEARDLWRLFIRYRERGDADALGVLFDRVAPELYALACRLCRNRAEAEDVLQATFLTAIQNVGRFDESREVLPWLYGILSWHARDARKKLMKAPDPDRLPERHVRDPADEAQEAEFKGLVESLLAGLPPTYRPVVHGYLVEGKEPAQLAAEMQLTAGAARVRLHRGLKLLRRALPAGLAPAAFGMRAAEWSALRERVLRAADSLPLPPLEASPQPLEPALSMSAGALRAAVVLLLATGGAAGFLVWRGSGRDARAATDTTEPGLERALLDPERGELDVVRPAGVPARAARPVSVDEPDGVLVLGQVLGNESELPVVDADVLLFYDNPTGPVLLRREPLARTDAAGRFRFRARLEAPAESLGRANFLLFAFDEGGVGWGELPRPSSEGRPRTVDIRVPPLSELWISVRDTAGVPVVGVQVECVPRFHPWPVFGAPGTVLSRDGQQRPERLTGLFCAATDAGGVARLPRLPSPLASPEVEPPSAGLALEARSRFGDARDGELARASEPRPFDYVVRLAARGYRFTEHVVRCSVGERTQVHVRALAEHEADVHGRVRADDASSLAGATIATRDSSVSSGDDGSFVIPGRDIAAFPLELRCELAGFEPARQRVELSESGRPVPFVEFHLRRSAAVAGRVRAADGAPAADRAVLLVHGGRQLSVTTDADGRFSFGDPALFERGADAAEILVPPAGEPPFPTVARSVMLGQRDLEITLAAPVPLDGGTELVAEIVDAGTGAPLAASIAIVLPCFEPLAVVPERERLLYPPLHAERTEGGARLSGLPPGAWNLWVQVPDMALAARRFDVRPGDERVLVRVPIEQHARIVGRITRGDPGQSARVFVRSGAGSLLPELATHPPLEEEALVDGDGAFVIERLVPGAAQLWIIRGGDVEDPQLASVQLHGGENRLDLSDGALGLLSLSRERPILTEPRVMALSVHRPDDAAWRLADLRLHQPGRIMDLEVWLPPGEYAWRVEEVPAGVPATGAAPIDVVGSVRVVAGERAALAF